MSVFRYVVLSTLILCISGCHYFFSSQTPEGVDLGPILTIQLNGDFDQMDKIRRLVPKKPDAIDQGPDTIVIYRESNKHEEKYQVYRSIEIYRATANSALEKYLQYKKTFTDKSQNWKLFEERSAGGDRFFSSYVTPWMDTNHGIPTGPVVHDPELLVGVLKGNIFVVVSYKGSIDNKIAHVQLMNEDIAYVADLLRTALSSAAAQQGIPSDQPRPATLSTAAQ